MLSNHLTFIQKNCSYLVVVGLLVSCASEPIQSNKERALKTPSSKFCKTESSKFEKRNLVAVAQIKSSVMVNCFKNFLRFEKDKSQYLGSCNQLSIKKDGRVSYVQVTDLKRKQLPRDFKMCLKQEFWKMNFKGLGLTQSYFIEFPLNFQAKN